MPLADAESVRVLDDAHRHACMRLPQVLRPNPSGVANLEAGADALGLLLQGCRVAGTIWRSWPRPLPNAA
eukprot:2108492-Pyramimonas_sp.AAC.1